MKLQDFETQLMSAFSLGWTRVAISNSAMQEGQSQDSSIQEEEAAVANPSHTLLSC